MTAVSVLVADPQRLFAEALATALAGDASLAVCQARPRSPAELLVAVEASRPDVVLADAGLAGADGLVTAIRERAPTAEVIVLSWLAEPDGVEEALAAGAAGWLPKSCDVAAVADAVRRAHAGGSPVDGGRVEELVRERQLRRAVAAEADRRLAQLTRREREVLERLAAGCTRQEIAEQLGATEHTIQTHIRNLKRKTGARTQLAAARLAWRHASAPRP